MRARQDSSEFLELLGDPAVEALTLTSSVWYKIETLPNDYKRSNFFILRNQQKRQSAID